MLRAHGDADRVHSTIVSSVPAPYSGALQQLLLLPAEQSSRLLQLTPRQQVRIIYLHLALVDFTTDVHIMVVWCMHSFHVIMTPSVLLEG